MVSFVPLRLRHFAFAVSGAASTCILLGLTQTASAQNPTGFAPSTGVLVVNSALPQISSLNQALAAASAKDAVISAFFAARGYEPFWTTADSDAQSRRRALLNILDTAGLHALPVERYNASALRRAFEDLRSEGDRARLEVRLTRALLDLARDLHSGVLDPSKIDPTIVRTLPRPEPVEVLNGFEADPAGFVQGLAPRHPEYARLLRARLALQDQVANGGWGPTVPGKSLKPGASGQSVVALRDRLMAMGYLGRSATNSYDSDITAAVREFQTAHGLTVDGDAGEATLTAMNISAEDRLKSVIVAIERERWANIERGSRHIWVNLADFTAKIIDDGKVSFSTRAVIGSTVSDKRTPEFSHRMTYLEVNPDWTVPPGIIRRDYLPRLQANPNALGHLQVVDSRGRVVPRGNIDFSQYSVRNFPFNLRQPPGPSNALGRVKFMFPNPWSIYLHDTPDKHLFARQSRAFSAGCVRLNDPFDLAYALLARQEEDPKRAFHRVLDSGKQTRINLKEPVPIHLDYRTAFTDVKGRLQFRSDIYGRDALIHSALIKAGVEG